MKNILIIIVTLCLRNTAQAQQGPTRWYGGVQAGVPLFWGDIRSIGEKTHLGFGGGLFLGLRATPWLAIEPSVDYGTGKLGAGSWQRDDYIDDNGIIRYTSGSHKLGDVYSKTSFLRAGVRIPVSIVQLAQPHKVPGVDVEIAPHVYFNHFTPGIYDAGNNNKLLDGVKPKSWAFAAGGDLAFNVKAGPRTAVFLRPSISWLSDERFEGISSDPLWRANLAAYTTLGVRFDLGKKTLALKPVRQRTATTVTDTRPIEVIIKKDGERKVRDKKNKTIKQIPGKKTRRS